MICATGPERTVAALRERQERLAEADLHELRLDLLDEPDAPLRALAAADPARLVVTCRPVRQGGLWDGDEARRIELLAAAAAAGAGFVDLEDDVEAGAADRVAAEAARGRTRVIRSCHRLAPGADPRRDFDRLRALRGHGIKLALQVTDAAELAPLRELGARRDRPVVLVGMGPAGLLSRVCYRRFGSAWTYVAASPGAETAPGQLCWAEARALGLGEAADPAPVALLGGPQVHGSPGPRVYNRLFRKLGARLVYLPVETDLPGPALALLRELGLAGASVTMPLKERVAPHLDGLEAEAEAAGAVNTIVRRGARLVGTNTDGLGAVRALERVRPLRGSRLVLLGAGGTARALARAALGAGARVLVANRTRSRAERLAADLGAEVVDDPLAGPFDVLVNATSVGLGSDESPIAEPAALAGKVVLDCVGQPERTRLVREAEAAGARAISGRELWLEQGAAQAGLWLGREVSADELRELLSR